MLSSFGAGHCRENIDFRINVFRPLSVRASELLYFKFTRKEHTLILALVLKGKSDFTIIVSMIILCFFVGN